MPIRRGSTLISRGCLLYQSGATFIKVVPSVPLNLTRRTQFQILLKTSALVHPNKIASGTIYARIRTYLHVFKRQFQVGNQENYGDEIARSNTMAFQVYFSLDWSRHL